MFFIYYYYSIFICYCYEGLQATSCQGSITNVWMCVWNVRYTSQRGTDVFEIVGNSTANHWQWRWFLVVSKKAVKVLDDAQQLHICSGHILQVGDDGVPLMFQRWQTTADSWRHITDRLSIWEAGFRHCEVHMAGVRTTTSTINKLNRLSVYNRPSTNYTTQ